MYAPFFGLRENPFSVQPDPRYAYPSAEHKIAIAKMVYAADEKRGLAVFTGPVGSGKTTCAQHLMAEWQNADDKVVGFLPSAAEATPAAFLRRVLEAFGQTSARNAADNLRLLERFLLDTYRAGRHAVLLLDEGQDVHPANIDTIADLTNFQTARSKLITVIMLAQDNLGNKLERKDKFRSRIAVVGHLDPLSFEDTCGMLAHRLETAGAIVPLSEFFDDGALREVYNITLGVPRDICILCDSAFVNGYVQNQKRMDAAIIERTMQQMAAEKRWPVTLGRMRAPTPKTELPADSESSAERPTVAAKKRIAKSEVKS